MEMRVDLNSSIPLSYFSEYIEREHPKREPVESKALSRSGGERLVGGSSGSNRTSDLAITIEHDERPPSGEEHGRSQNPDWQEVGIAQTTEHEERLGISYFFQKKKTGRYERVFSQYLIKVALNKDDALDRGLAERALEAAIPVGSRFRASSPSNTILSQVCKITILLRRMGKASFTIDEHPPSSRRACPLLRLGPCVSVRPMHPQMR